MLLLELLRKEESKVKNVNIFKSNGPQLRSFISKTYDCTKI